MKSRARMSPDDPGVTKLADYLCFGVYSANLAIGKSYKPLLEELGLTYTQYITIIALWEEDNQTVGSLGEKLFLESNTLTPTLKRLEGMGYLRRQRDTVDERQVRIGLTEAGYRLRESALIKGKIAEMGLTPEELAKTQQALVTIRESLLKAMKAKGQNVAAS